MSVRTSTWKAVADFSSLLKSSAQATSNLEKLEKATRSASTALSATARESETAARALRASSSSVTAFSSAVRRGMQEAAKASTTAASEISRSATEVTKAADKIANTGSRASSAAAGYKNAGTAAGNMAFQVQRAATAAGSASSKFAQTGASATKAGDAVGKAGAEAGASAGKWARLGAVLGSTNGILLLLPGAGASAAAAVGLVAEKALEMGVNFNATKEQSLTAFTTILKSGTKANDLMARIVETARVTPFQTEDLVKQVRQLLSFGLPLEKVLTGSGREAKGLVITLGNAVAAMGGTGEMVETTTRAIGQMFAKGKVSAEELQQLAESGIPVYQILQQELGLTASQVQNIGKAGISATDAIDALSRGMEKRFGGAMDAQSKTFKGIISTLSDNIEIGLGRATEGLFNKMKTVLQGVGDFMTDLNKRAQQVGFIQAISEKAPLVGQILDALSDSGRSLLDILKQLGPAAGAFTSLLAGTGLSTAMITLRAISIILQTIAAILDSIPDPVKQWIGYILAAGVAAKGLSTAFTYVKSVLTAITAGKAVTFFKDLLATIKSVRFVELATGASTLGATLKGVGAGAKQAAGNVGSMVPVLGSLSLRALALAGGIGAALAAVVLLSHALKPNYEAQQSTRSAADSLTKSLGLQVGAVKASTAAYKENTQAKTENAGTNDKFARDNEKTIGQLKRIKDATQQREYLIQVGFILSQKGVKPDEIIASLSRLAKEAGITIPLNINTKDIYDLHPVLKGIQNDATGIAQSFDHANDVAHKSFLYGGSSDELTDLGHRIADVAKNAKDLAGKDAIGAAVSEMAAFEKGVHNAATEAENKRQAMTTFTNDIKAAFKDVDFGKFKDVKGLLTNVAGGAKGASKQFQDYAKAVLKAADANGGDLTKAIDEVNKKYPDLAGNLIKASDAQEKFTTSAGKSVKVYKEDTEAIKAYQEVLDSFKDFGAAINAAFTPIQKISDVVGKVVQDAGKGTASLASVNNALVKSAQQAQTYRKNLDVILSKAGPADGLPIIQMIKDMGEKGPAYAANLAKGTKGQLDNLAKNIKNAGPEMAVSWKQFAATLQDQIRTQNQFTANLLTLEAMGFTALADNFRAKGPEAAAALAQAVRAPISDLKALNDALTASAGISADKLSKISYAIQLFKTGGIHNIHDFATAMGTDIKGAYGIIDNLRTLIKSFPPKIRTEIEALLNAIAPPPVVIHGKVVLSGPAGGRWATTGFGGGHQVEADGGVLEFYRAGGTRPPTRAVPQPSKHESHVAQIAPAGAWRVWAEPETGGEAYLPMAPGKRRRSLSILDVVLRKFGLPDLSMIAGLSSMTRGLASAADGAFFKLGGMTLSGHRDDISKVGYNGGIDTSQLVNFFHNLKGTVQVDVPAVGGAAGSAGVVAAVRAVAAQFGWGSGAQWNALSSLISGESGWNPSAANPTSSARGLFQKLTSAHGPIEGTVGGQASWGLSYIRSSYGSPINAYSKWLSRSPHWYGEGGLALDETNLQALKRPKANKFFYLPSRKSPTSSPSSGSGLQDSAGNVLHAASGYYTVRRGDTLSSIASRYKMSWRTLYNLNRGVVGPNPNAIRPGERLRLSAATRPAHGAARPNAAARAAAAARQKKHDAIWKYAGHQYGLGVPGETTGSLSGILSDLQQRKETYATNVAAARAATYKKVWGHAAPKGTKFKPSATVTPADFGKDLATQTKNMTVYQNSLNKIARVAGGDAATALRDMGDAGIKLANDLARQSTPTIQKMAQQITALADASKAGIDEWSGVIASSNKNTAEFNANLVKLAQMGYGDLAGQLQGLGVEQGGLLARQAVSSPSAAATAQANLAEQTRLSQTNVADLVKLISWLKTQTGTPGLRDVGRGTGFTDAYASDLVNNNLATLKSITAASKLIQDAARFKAGTFYASGGIMPAHMVSAGRGPITWAEHSTGGESWIPHARSKRRDALRIWAKTGAILGADGGDAMTYFARGGFGALAPSSIRSAGLSSITKDAGGDYIQNLNFNTIINNPVAEKSTESVNKLVTSKAQLGLFGRRSTP